MDRLKKWYIKLNIKRQPLNFAVKFVLRDESRYRLCLYKLLIYRLIVYVNINKKYLFPYKEVLANNFYIWKNTIKSIKIINENIWVKQPYNKVNKIIKKLNNFNKRSYLIEIYNLYYLNYINIVVINYKDIKINYIFRINNFTDLFIWIFFVNLEDINKLNDKLICIFSNIKQYQDKCKNINYYYNNNLFDSDLQKIFIDIKYILINYENII